MRALHLAAAKAALDVEIQTDKREREGDRPAMLICSLSCERINYVLMNECHIATRKRVGA